MPQRRQRLAGLNVVRIGPAIQSPIAKSTARLTAGGSGTRTVFSPLPGTQRRTTGGTSTTNSAAPTVTASSDGASSGSVTGAYIVGGIGLVAGLAVLGLAPTGRRRRGSLDQTADRVSTGV